MAYDTSQNVEFFARIGNLARELQSVREEATRLNELYDAEGISGHADFISVGSNTPAEATDVITLALALDAFFNNAIVATADRKANLTPFLANG